MVLENSFDRGDELDADKEGILLVQKGGLRRHRTVGISRASGRTQQGAAEKNGLFASHPETQERIEKVKQLAASKPGALVAARYTSNITYQPTELTKIATSSKGRRVLRAASRRRGREEGRGEESGEKEEGFRRRESHQIRLERRQDRAAGIASGGARGVGADRLAKGGDNPNRVNGAFTPAELLAFKKGIA
jgi:predicted Zn-dependent protease